MKKSISQILRIVVLCLVITTICVSFFACQDKGATIDPNAVTKEDCIKVVSDTEIILFVSNKLENLENKTALDLLDVYVEKGYLTYSATDGSYGKFITTINGKEANPSNEFWAIYTSDETVSSTEYSSYKYEDKTLGSSNYGVSFLKIKAGDIIVFRLESF